MTLKANQGTHSVSRIQAIFMLTHFMICGIQIVNIFNNEYIPVWAILLFSAVLSIPLMLVFSRISAIYPNKDIFQIFTSCFGRTGGKIFAAVYTLYALWLASVNMRYTGEYVQITSLPDTPLFVFVFAVSVFCWWILRHGIEVFARFSAVVFPIMLICWILILLMSLRFFDFSYMMPAFTEDIPDMMTSGMDLASFSFMESFICLSFIGNVKKSKSGAFGIYFPSFALSFLFIFLLTENDMLILGRSAMSGLYFPHFSAMSIINIGEFITNIEVLGILLYVISATVKLCICIFTAVKGLAFLFDIEDEKMLTAPVVLMTAISAPSAFRSTLEMIRFNTYYKYISALFCIILPIILYATCEIKYIINKRRKKNEIRDYGSIP